MGFVVKCCSLLVLLAAVFLGFVFLYEGTMFRLLPQDDVPGLMNLLNSFKADNSAAKTVEDYDKKFNSVPDVSMVNDYYNMATDFYEYGWGQSFHFYTQRKGESHEEAIVRHEKNMVDTLGITAGMNVLDAGCGVGGPARTVARLSGAKVLGVTINDYQVMRARNHTERAGLSHLVEFKQGDYNKLDFIADASFDRAYASESTCHAVNLEGPYGQIFRVLKPGGLFFSYEWLATKHADRKNPEHARILRDIEYGDGLPPLRTLEEALAAAKNVGFELVKEEDLAEVVPKGGKPWYDRLDMGWLQHKLTHVMCWVMELLGLAPVVRGHRAGGGRQDQDLHAHACAAVPQARCCRACCSCEGCHLFPSSSCCCCCCEAGSCAGCFERRCQARYRSEKVGSMISIPFAK
eukprot:gnl/Spiro4/12683_TR6719_c0_g1_i1.p1 gnl/Spiro4/12683_TR6719_c0_g1~~gnl/Spiro4/12683_TR6719_c0_g1_i1.p1  ORF type:complete len:425 (-),score=139.66 gnl/Spiro4/12683_TR6719_c0_g1_i1:10-1227(-)